MAANDGWFAQWFAGGWFPAVWSAPADESHPCCPRKSAPAAAAARASGTWRRSPSLVFDARRNPVDEEAAMLLCGAL